MQVERYQPIVDIHAIANLCAEAFEPHVEALCPLLKTLGKDIVSGLFTPAQETTDDLTIIRIRALRTGGGSIQQQIARQIDTIFSFLHTPGVEKICRYLIGSESDHTLILGQERIGVNRQLLMHVSPFFKALWTGGMSESLNQSETTLCDIDPDLFRVLWNMLLGNSVQIDDINRAIELMHLLDRFGMAGYKDVSERVCELTLPLLHPEVFQDKAFCVQLLSSLQPLFDQGHFYQLQKALLPHFSTYISLDASDQPFTLLACRVAERELMQALTDTVEGPDLQALIDKVINPFDVWYRYERRCRCDAALLSLYQQIKMRIDLVIPQTLRDILQNAEEQISHTGVDHEQLIASLGPVLHTGFFLPVRERLVEELQQRLFDELALAEDLFHCQIFKLPYVQKELFSISGVRGGICGLRGFLGLTFSEERVRKAVHLVIYLLQQTVNPLYKQQCKCTLGILLQTLPEESAKEWAKTLFTELRGAQYDELCAYQATLYLANLYRLLGEREKAKELLQTICETSAHARILLAHVYVEEEHNLTKALELAEDDLRAYLEQAGNLVVLQKLAQGDSGTIDSFFYSMERAIKWMPMRFAFTPFSSIVQDCLQKVPEQYHKAIAVVHKCQF